MSEADTDPPRLRGLRTTLFYTVVWPLVGGASTVVAALFGDSPMSAGSFLTSPSEMLGFLVICYLFGAVPAALNGLIVALISPGPRPVWMLPAVSGIWGMLLFGMTGYMSVKTMGAFAVIGAIAGAGTGAILAWKRARFEQPPKVPAMAPPEVP